MNFSGFNFDESTKKSLITLDKSDRLPHAMIIECKDKQKSLKLAEFLSMYVVCTSDEKPCGVCSQCHKAKNAAHADIKYAYPEKKSKTYSIDQMREIAKDAYILPNEAASKVYIFEEADVRLSAIAQNSFLKLLEEPPKNVFFILLCENANRLLITILSRCTVLKIKSERTFCDTAAKNAESIVRGIISPREYDLLTAVNLLCDKDFADETLSAAALIMRDGLAILSGGKPVTDAALGQLFASRFTKKQIIEMIELTDSTKLKINKNININLLATWLCGEYRRISWQR